MLENVALRGDWGDANIGLQFRKKYEKTSSKIKFVHILKYFVSGGARFLSLNSLKWFKNHRQFDVFLGGNLNLSFRFQNFLEKQDPDSLVMITDPQACLPP